MKRAVFLIFVVLIGAYVLPAGAKDKNELVICSWGGSLEKAQREAYFDPFEKATGIKVITANPPNAAKIKAMVESGNMEWDIVIASYGILGACLKQNLVEQIDYKYFDKKTLDEIYPEAKQPQCVGAYYFSIVPAYNTDVYSKSNHPRSWAEFWDVKKFPGPRSLYDLSVSGASSWEFALLADGVPMDQLYNNPDLDRAFKKLSEIKPHVTKWWKMGQEPGQLLSDKEVVLSSAYDGRIQKLNEEGAHVNYDFNQGMLWLEYLFIPRKAPNYDNALKFMAFYCDADRQAYFSKIFPYGPINRKAFEALPSERARILPSYPDNRQKQFLMGGKWYMENMTKVIERWNSWILEK
jgi:putative spermidine/putrescine transport system substrate-binding protein